MTRDDIIRMAKEAGWSGIYSKPLLSITLYEDEFLHFAALVAAAEREACIQEEREKVAAWMRSKSYTTGHGDTIEDLLKELEWQVAEREREACAKVAGSYEPTCDTCPSGVANAIRARGNE